MSSYGLLAFIVSFKDLAAIPIVIILFLKFAFFSPMVVGEHALNIFSVGLGVVSLVFLFFGDY